MSNESPAAIIYDALGHPVGVILDGSIYRLQVDAKLTDGYATLGTLTNPIISQSSLIQKKVLYDIGDPIIYIGTASMGTLSSSAAWLIKKVTLSGGNPVSTQWSTTSAIWDNRALETYS
jgi:hypothetical protein